VTPETLLVVLWPRAVFGLRVRDGVVFDAAPMGRRSIGRPAAEVVRFYRGRGARVVQLDCGVDGAPPPEP
jgi:hypothetical protein